MAQVSIPPPVPPPPSPAAMSRRAPLSTLPNAVNSPYHSVTAAAAKRQRSQREVTYGQPPPIKKQIVEVTVKTPVRVSHTESRIGPARKQASRGKSAAAAAAGGAGSPPAFVNGVVDTRQQQQHHHHHQPQQRKAPAKHGDLATNLDSVRAWQRHYKKAFPTYVFYFESIPDDVAVKCQKQVTFLGARLERFFSSAVTHVITTRTIPPEADREGVSKAEFTFKAPSRKYSTNKVPQDEARESGSRSTVRGPRDILLKAREYHMKIWALEKLQRMMNVMFEVTPGYQTTRELIHAAQSNTTNVDLTHVLRNERLHGPTDRDPSAAPTDLVYFKGYFIYVHDMVGINRPIMVREYQKVSKREQGTWPQFRSVSGGKCPFIEEAVHQKREKERERQLEKMERTREKEKEIGELTKSRATRVFQQEESMRQRPRRVALGEMHNLEHRPKVVGTQNRAVGRDGLFQVPPVIPAKRGSAHTTNDVAFTSAHPTTNTRGGEPVASGVQPSNITSAIRSHMVSSIADQPGRRAGTSKGIYELKRKVAGNVLLGNATAGKAIPNSQRMINLAGAAGMESQSLKAAQDRKRKLGLSEKVAVREQREDVEKRIKQKAKDSKGSRKESRPGYCENCREKFDDFEDHTNSRRHRRFAANDGNWADLDDLLVELRRPLRRHQRH